MHVQHRRFKLLGLIQPATSTQAMLGAYTLPTHGDGVISFATQLTAPHLAHLWVPSTERDVLLPAATFVAAAASAAAILRNDKPHRRTALASRQTVSFELLHALVVSAFLSTQFGIAMQPLF